MTNHSTTSPVLLRRIKTAQKSLGRVRHLPIYIFVKELVANPRNIGAACPSSKKLADSIAALVSPPQDGYVVELGAGTGVVTAALLRRGISPERLIVVEKSKHLANMLKKKFPDIRIIHGDAAALDQLLPQSQNYRYLPVSTIVSSLPLRSLPENIVKQISQQIEQTIPENGSLIQFTYDIRRSKSPDFGSLRYSHSKLVWRNLPPARIHLLRKTETLIQ